MGVGTYAVLERDEHGDITVWSFNKENPGAFILFIITIVVLFFIIVCYFKLISVINSVEN